jgi:tRNA A37 methylthiotransferase MiaB
MKNVYLFQINYQMGYGNYSSQSLPYSVATVWAYAEQFDIVKQNYNVLGCFFKREPIEDVLAKITNPDLCFFSNYIWNEQYNFLLADLIKRKWPNCLIVFGGPQVGEKVGHELLTKSFIDSIVVNEGEKSLLSILTDYTNTGKINQIYNLHQRVDVECMPSPYLDSNILTNLVAQNPNTKFSTTIETNRGCPFACTFCDWGSLTQSKIKKFNLEKVFNELEWIVKNKIEYVYIADANFGVFYERDKLIVEYLAKLKKETGYPHGVTATWYKNSAKQIIELVKILHDVGLNRGLTLSVQSMNDETLDGIKRKNMEISQLSHMYKECDKQGVTYYTEFIVGMPYETKQSWREGLCKATQAGCHYFLDVFPLEILKNSEMADEVSLHQLEVETFSTVFKGQLTDVPEIHNYVISTKYMNREEYIDSWLWYWLIMNFHNYNWTQVLAKFANKYLNIDYIDFYENFFNECVLKEPFFLNLYNQQRDDLIKFFWDKQTSAVFVNDNVTINYNQIEWHNNRETVLSIIEQWATKYFSNIDNSLLTELLEFSKLYTVNIDRTELVTKEFNYNFNEFCNFLDPLEVNKIKYNFDISIPWESKIDFKEKLFYKNRSGFSVSKISRI